MKGDIIYNLSIKTNSIYLKGCLDGGMILSYQISDIRYLTRFDRSEKLEVVAEYNPTVALNLKSFRWRSVNCWNQLPIQVRQIESISEFKPKLKKWIEENIEI